MTVIITDTNTSTTHSVSEITLENIGGDLFDHRRYKKHKGLVRYKLDGVDIICSYYIWNGAHTLGKCFKFPGLRDYLTISRDIAYVLLEEGKREVIWDTRNNFFIIDRKVDMEHVTFTVELEPNDSLVYLGSKNGGWQIGLRNIFRTETSFEQELLNIEPTGLSSYPNNYQDIIVWGTDSDTQDLKVQIFIENTTPSACGGNCLACDKDLEVDKNCFICKEGYRWYETDSKWRCNLPQPEDKYILSNSVLFECPMFMRIINQYSCDFCPTNNCADCRGEDPNFCLKCKPGFMWENYQCNTPCFENCARCPTSVDVCEECMEGFYLKENTCHPCEEGCKRCEAPTGICLECLKSTDPAPEKDCVEECPTIMIRNGESCVECSQDSGYFLRFGNCSNCWIENDKEVCPVEFDFYLKEGGITISDKALEVTIEPGLEKRLEKEEISGVKFNEIFELRINEEDNQTGIEGPISFTTTVKGSSEARTLLELRISDKYDFNVGQEIKLSTENSDGVVFQSLLRSRPDPKFSYIRQKSINIPIRPNGGAMANNGLVKTVSSYSQVNDGVSIGMIFIDPTGIWAKITQMMKVINRFVFINMEFGEELTPFLENCAKIDPDRAFTEAELRRNEHFRAKFRRYGVGYDEDGKMLTICLIYIGSLLLRILEHFLKGKIYQKISKNEKGLRPLLWVVWASRKLRFSIFCSCLPRVGFYGLRVLFFSESTGRNNGYRCLVVVSSVLIVLDFVLIYKNIEKLIKKENKVAPKKKQTNDPSESIVDINMMDKSMEVDIPKQNVKKLF